MKFTQLILALLTLSLALYIILTIKTGQRNEIILLALLGGSVVAYLVHLWQKKQRQ